MLQTRTFPIEKIEVSAFNVPTAEPQSDATLAWDATTMVVVEAHAGGHTGLGFGYTHVAAAHLIAGLLAGVVEGTEALSVERAWHAMHHQVRNLGRPGLCSEAISAVDIALWDLKAHLLDLPLATLLGAVRDEVPVYGSGGFTAYSTGRLQEQCGRWADEGFMMVKMKVARQPEDDLQRVEAVRAAIGDDVDLFVDANGGYTRKQALWFADAFADLGASWFEEPVSSDDLEGLRLIRDRAPAGMEITAGEYGFELFYFRRMLDAGAVDVLQVDTVRCGGYTGFLKAAVLGEACNVPLSSHNAPGLHVPVCCAARPVRHVEYFYEHARIERLLLDGVIEPRGGCLRPDRSRPGHGLALKAPDAERYRVFG